MPRHITIYPIRVFCKKCNQILYRYDKEGPGMLVKCFVDRITEDYTDGKLACPKCGQEFARRVLIKGRPANKIISGKAYKQGRCGD